MVASQVRPNDVTDLRIQRALEAIPRELFLPPELRVQAYVDREIPYAAGRSLITPRDFAKLLAALEIKPTDLILDVACGSGYSTAVLSLLGEMVVAVEDDQALAAKAQQNWSEAGVVNAALVAGEPWRGAPQQGPFDVIMIAQAIEIEPKLLLEQLQDGGRLGAVMRRGDVAKGVVWRRSGGVSGWREIFDASARVAPAGFTRPKAFVF